MVDRDEITIRTQLAEVRAEQRAVRERLDARERDSLRRHELHIAADERAFTEVRSDVKTLAEEMRAEFKAVRDSIAALDKGGAVQGVKLALLVALAGALGSAVVAVVVHFIERIGS